MRHVSLGAGLWVLSISSLFSVALAEIVAENAVTPEQQTTQQILQALSGGHAVAPEFSISVDADSGDENGLESPSALDDDVESQTIAVKILTGPDGGKQTDVPIVESSIIEAFPGVPSTDPENAEKNEAVATENLSDSDEPLHSNTENQDEEGAEEEPLTPVAELKTDVLENILEELPTMQPVQSVQPNNDSGGEIFTSDEAAAKTIVDVEGRPESKTANPLDNESLIPVAELAKNYKIVTEATQNGSFAEGDKPDNGHYFESPPPEQHFSIEVFGWAPLTDDLALPDDELLLAVEEQAAEKRLANDSEPDAALPVIGDADANNDVGKSVKQPSIGLWLFIIGCCLAIFLGLRWLHTNLFNRSLFA